MLTITAAQGLAAAQGFLAAHGFIRELRGVHGLARQGEAIAKPPIDKVSTPDEINILVRFDGVMFAPALG